MIFLILHNEYNLIGIPKGNQRRLLSIGETAGSAGTGTAVMLASQKRIPGDWRASGGYADVVEAIPGMNNITVILRVP
ncbi:hypothetical protein ACLK1S_04370 [Escherichia coli]